MAENRMQHRLYLAKGDKEDIYVDTVYLPQHQYDGIRFLFRQLKKGKAGVILNDPPGYGKRVQTVVFVSAMRPVSTVPTLILCSDGIEEVWAQLFRQWTNMGSDVLVQKSNEYTKSVCVIGTFSQVHLLCRREWGIVVVDDTRVTRDSLRTWLSAKYRIWLTSIDMKYHLQTFSLIYKWMYPKDKFNVEDFRAGKKPSSVLATAVKLDAFMEDIVIRRNVALGNLLTPVCHPVSRKNKDATGKKVKRSKPSNHDHNSSTESQEASTEQNIPTVHKNGQIKDKEDFVFNINNEETKMDLDIDDIVTVKTNRNKEAANNSQIKSKKVQERDKMDIDNVVPKGYLTPESDTRDGDVALLSRDSQNIIIKYDSETEDNEIENPAKKPKITYEMIVSENIFSTDIVPSDSDKVSNDSNEINLSANKTDPLLSGIEVETKQMEELSMNKIKGS